MPPVAFGILAATKLFGDLMGQAAERRKTQRELEYQGIQKGYDTQMQGIQNMGSAQQGSIEDIIQQYRSLA